MSLDHEAPPAFSQHHRFTRAEITDAAAAVAAEGARKRLLINLTSGHRRLSMRQSMISLSLGGLLMLSIYVTERLSPTLERSTLNMWTLLGLLNMAVRAGIFYKVFFLHLPADIAKSLGLRLLPLSIVLIGAVYWIWTIQLFIDHSLTLNTFVLFVGFLGISIGVMGMWPTVPIVAIIYLATTWPPFFYRLYEVGAVPFQVVFLLAACVTATLWASVFLQINQVQPILDHGDKADLLVADLHDANVALTSSNASLDAIRKQAMVELDSRSLFFTSASHDFRQRLHAMKLLAHSTIDSSTTTSVNTMVHRLADSVADVERYVTGILDFARIESGPLQSDKQVVDLQRLFQQLDVDFEEVAVSANVQLVVRATKVWLLTDASMLQRILENLLSNAIKFSSGRVLVAARRRAGSVALEVWDQGIGIPLEARGSIFNPFHQLSIQPKGRGGAGLGLVVVKRFADCLGYQIFVRSQVGRGTVMTVLVPPSDVRKSEDHGER